MMRTLKNISAWQRKKTDVVTEKIKRFRMRENVNAKGDLQRKKDAVLVKTAAAKEMNCGAKKKCWKELIIL